MVGFDVGTVRNLHSAFLRDGEAALKLSGKGGRYHAYLTEEEEASWLEGFRDAGENGGILEVGRIQAAFEEKVGRKVAKSTVYDLLHRHGWRIRLYKLLATHLSASARVGKRSSGSFLEPIA